MPVFLPTFPPLPCDPEGENGTVSFLGFCLHEGQGLANALVPSQSFPENAILKCIAQCAPLSLENEILAFKSDPCSHRVLHSDGHGNVCGRLSKHSPVAQKAPSFVMVWSISLLFVGEETEAQRGSDLS